MIFDLPTALEVGGQEWAINTDYRDILVILSAFEDEELTDQEKAYVCLDILYVDFAQMPGALASEAFEKALGFIDHGNDDKGHGKKTMDWEQDAPILFPAVNHVAGYEVRSVEYLHWWTFMGYFMEIKDSVYANVLSLRQKKARGKKLEKWEQEFWRTNSKLCVLKRKDTESDKAVKEKYEAILGGKSKE